MSTPHAPGPDAQGHGHHGHGHPGHGHQGAPQSPFLQPGQPGAYGGPPPPKRSTANVVLIVFLSFFALMVLGVTISVVIVLGGIFSGMGTGASPALFKATQAISAMPGPG